MRAVPARQKGTLSRGPSSVACPGQHRIFVLSPLPRSHATSPFTPAGSIPSCSAPTHRVSSASPEASIFWELHQSFLSLRVLQVLSNPTPKSQAWREKPGDSEDSRQTTVPRMCAGWELNNLWSPPRRGARHRRAGGRTAGVGRR